MTSVCSFSSPAAGFSGTSLYCSRSPDAPPLRCTTPSSVTTVSEAVICAMRVPSSFSLHALTVSMISVPFITFCPSVRFVSIITFPSPRSL